MYAFLSLAFSLTLAMSVSAETAGMQVIEQRHATSMQVDGRTLWTYNHDPAEGKPYLHPLATTEGTVLTDLRPDDHPWHRAVWFSWKFINGVNYWEENPKTGKSQGETRLKKVEREVADDHTVRFSFALEYAPAGSDQIVMKEQRRVNIMPPDGDGVYRIHWSSEFTALDEEVVIDRTPLEHEPGGARWGGYAGWSVRMNPQVRGGDFVNNHGQIDAHREPASWNLYQGKSGGGILFMDHPGNLNTPNKWYISPGMGYFSPAVLHDTPHTIKAGESLRLRYVLVILPGEATKEIAEREWEDWVKTEP